jgi:hypothetical protein
LGSRGCQNRNGRHQRSCAILARPRERLRIESRIRRFGGENVGESRTSHDRRGRKQVGNGRTVIRRLINKLKKTRRINGRKGRRDREGIGWIKKRRRWRREAGNDEERKEEGRWRERVKRRQEERESWKRRESWNGKLRQNQGRCCGHSPAAVSALPPLAANYPHSWFGQKRTCGV